MLVERAVVLGSGNSDNSVQLTFGSDALMDLAVVQELIAENQPLRAQVA
jgi:hypothetical protein